MADAASRKPPFLVENPTPAAERFPLPPAACRFCGHATAPDAKFCSACGAQVNLLPCPRCGAVNDKAAAACYQCKRPLSGAPAKEELLDPTPAEVFDATPAEVLDATPAEVLDATPAEVLHPEPAEVLEPKPTAGSVFALVSRSHWILIALAVAVIAALAYYAVRPSTNGPAARPSQSQDKVAPVQPPTAGSDEVSQRAKGAAGAIKRNAGTDDKTPPKADETVPPAVGSAGRPRVDSKPSQAISPDACTDATAALGLCVRNDASRPNAGTQAEETATAGGRQEPRRSQVCTQARAALGLCAL